MGWLPSFQVHLDFITIVHFIRIFFHKKRLVISTFSFPLFISYGVILWPLIKGQVDLIWECQEYSSNGRLIADCSNQGKNIGVPINLNPKIEVLNLSNNRLLQISNESFERYKDTLTVLDLSKCYNPYPIYDAWAFMSLTKLLSLNLSSTCLPAPKSGYMVQQQFPKTVVEFIYNNCHTEDNINLTSMENLQVFFGANCLFNIFPIFSTTSPLIKFVNLSFNPLGSLKAIQMAPYCLLEEMIFEQSPYQNFYSGLTNTRKFCTCVRIRKWLDYAKVKYPKENLKCKMPQLKPIHCTLEEISPGAIEVRNRCLAKYGSSNSFKLLLISLVIIGASVYVALSIRSYLKKRNTEASDAWNANEEDVHNDDESLHIEKP